MEPGLAHSLRLGPGVHGVTFDGDQLTCRTECSFGFEPGMWRMTFDWQGSRPRTMSFDAQYTHSETTNHRQTYQIAVRIDVLLTQLDP